MLSGTVAACGDRLRPPASSEPSEAEGPRALEAQVPHALLVPAEVVGDLVADGAGDLRAQLLRVVAEVPDGGVTEDQDAVGIVVPGDGVALVEAVGPTAAPLVR